MANETSKTNLIKFGKNELMKVHYVYDVDRRTTHIYQAPRDAGDGDPCLVSKFDYEGSYTEPAGSTEYQGAWDASWDIAEG